MPIQKSVDEIKYELPNHIRLKDWNTGITHESKVSNNRKGKNILEFKKAYDIIRFKTHFAPIDDSTCISIYFNPEIYVDSLYLFSKYLFYEVYKYRVPLYNHSPLLSREDSIRYSNNILANYVTSAIKRPLRSVKR